VLEVDRQSGGFTACNACPACPVEPGSPRLPNGILFLRLFHRGEIYSCNSEAHFTGVPSGCSTGVECLPRGISTYSTWGLLLFHSGSTALKNVFSKAPPYHVVRWSFFMSILVNNAYCLLRKTEHESRVDLTHRHRQMDF
jgi:hypothetical protein